MLVAHSAYFERLENSLFSISLQMQPILEMAKSAETDLTPSSDCKSSAASKRKFNGLLACLGLVFPLKPDQLQNVPKLSEDVSLDWSFDWQGRSEDASYMPLKEHLQSIGIFSAVVGSGSGLPDGLLYDVDIYTLRPRRVSAHFLNETERPSLRYKLHGRTDLVVVRRDDDGLINRNIKYYIEIKTRAGFKLGEALKETVLQLIGGNVAADYHSPGAILTNLFKKHFYLRIVCIGDPVEKLSYKLEISKCSTFGDALARAEQHSAVAFSVTRDMGRMSTPSASVRDVDEDLDFGNMLLEDVNEKEGDEELFNP